MYEDFLIENPNYCIYSTYHAVFKKEDIWFGEPKEDVCDSGAIYKNLQGNEIAEGLYISQEKNMTKLQNACQTYNEDNSKVWSSNRSFVVDMQKVLLLAEFMLFKCRKFYCC